MLLSPNSPYSICSNERGDKLLKMINFLIPAALLLCGSLTGKQKIAVHAANIAMQNILLCLLSSFLHAGAQESRIRNFQVVSQNDTHITFSWEIVDGYFSSSDISYFQLYYEYRASSTYSIYIRFSDTTQNGTTFTYTSPLEAFINNYNYYYNYADGYGFGKYIIWTQAYRSGLIPRYTYSERLYVDLGKCDYIKASGVHHADHLTVTC